jgi:hypothetical protein
MKPYEPMERASYAFPLAGEGQDGEGLYLGIPYTTPLLTRRPCKSPNSGLSVPPLR